MRVLFVSPPHAGFEKYRRPQLTFSVCRIPAVGILSIAAYLRKHGHECRVVDGNRLAWRFGNLSSPTYDEMARLAVKFKPDIIGVTLLTADFYESRKTIRVLRRVLPKAVIMAGGPHPSGEPRFTLKQIPELDGVGIGPGEEICLDLADGKPVDEIEEGRVETDLDKYPFPAWDLIDGDYYAELNHATVFGLLTKSLLVLSSRGCSGRCYFCSWRWNRPLRTHSVGYVLDLCAFLANRYPIDTITFWDDTMAADRNRLVELCEGFIQRKLGLNWVAQVRADQVKTDLLMLMKEAGCVKVSFGAESGCDRVLKLLRKGITVQQNIEAAEAIHEAGLHLDLSLMLGVPSETLEEMMETVGFIKRFPYATCIGVGRFCPLPGSPAYHEFVKSGKIDRENVNWELLGNFSSVAGPYFGEANPERFRALLTMIQEVCLRQYMRNFRRNNIKQYPEVVNLYFPRETYTEPLRKMYLSLPSEIRQSIKRTILGGY